MLRGAVILLLLSVAAAVATHLWHPAAPPLYLVEIPAGENEVTVSEVAAKWNNDVIWIDARLKERFDSEHIPGALLINEYDLDNQVFANLEKLQTSGKPIIVYCDGIKCEASHKVRDYLATNIGLPDVWVLTGGWPAWKEKGKTQ